MPSYILISFVALLFATIGILSDIRGRWILAHLFRPLTMLIIIGLAAVAPGTSSYKWGIVAGLSFSLAGDIFMMLRKKKFIQGLACFLVAQICYIFAFGSGIGNHLRFWPLAFLLPYVLILGSVLLPRTGRMKVPVLIYVAALTLMTWLAWERYLGSRGNKTFFALAGAILFVVSDSVLAHNRFVRPRPWAQPVILGTYFSAQLLISLSV